VQPHLPLRRRLPSLAASRGHPSPPPPRDDDDDGGLALRRLASVL
jgi:hypothetical protein